MMKSLAPVAFTGIATVILWKILQILMAPRHRLDPWNSSSWAQDRARVGGGLRRDLWRTTADAGSRQERGGGLRALSTGVFPSPGVFPWYARTRYIPILT